MSGGHCRGGEERGAGDHTEADCEGVAGGGEGTRAGDGGQGVGGFDRGGGVGKPEGQEGVSVAGMDSETAKFIYVRKYWARAYE